MAWDPITESELNPGYPVLKHMRKAWNCLLWLYGLIGTTSSDGVQNGSFEIDSDGGGVPDTWTWSAYAGGSIAIDTTTPAHGAAAVKITHPGGAGNGGGTLTSDYIVCGALVPVRLQWIHWSSAAGMNNKINIRYYTAGKSFISSTTIYTSTANPTTATLCIGGFTPPATSRYYKIEIIGGYTDTNVAGSAYFDGFAAADPVDYATTLSLSGTGGLSVWADMGSATITLPFIPCGSLKTELLISITATSYAVSPVFRLRSGTDYSEGIMTHYSGYAGAYHLVRLVVSGSSKSFSVVFQGCSGGEDSITFAATGSVRVGVTEV